MARRTSGASGRLNDILAGYLVFIVAIAPIPLGSNRPAFWALLAVMVAGAATIYGAGLLSQGAKLRFALKGIAVPLILFALVCVWLIFQMVPTEFMLGPWEYVTLHGASIISQTLSLDPGDTLFMLVRMLTYGLFFVLMLQVCVNRARARRLLFSLFVIITIHAIYALIALTQLGDPILFFEKWAYHGVATGTFVNRNSFATFLAIGCTIGLSLVLRQRQKGNAGLRKTSLLSAIASSERFATIALSVALAIIFVALLATQSRMGLAASLVGMLVVLLLSMRQNRQRVGLGIGLLIGFGLLAGAALLFFYGQGVLDRLGSLETSSDVRSQVYVQVLEMIQRNPFFGYGGGSFELAFPLYQHPPVSPDLLWDKAHSTYLTLWVELGVVFGSLPMLIYAYFAFQLARMALTRESDWAAPTAAFGAIVAGALHSTVDFSLEMEANVFLLLAVVAIGFAAKQANTGSASVSTKPGSATVLA